MAFPGTYNFRYYKGDTFEFIIRPKDGSGNAFPLDTYLDSATFTIATVRGAGGTRHAGLAVVDTANDIITCTITPTVGEDLTPGVTWYYDIEVILTQDLQMVGYINIYQKLVDQNGHKF
jgi:hypothetical protein